MSTAWERVLLSHGTDDDLEALAAACLTALRVWKWKNDTAWSLQTIMEADGRAM